MHFKVAQTSFNTFKRSCYQKDKLTVSNTSSCNSNVMVPYETSIIAEQDTVIFVTRQETLGRTPYTLALLAMISEKIDTHCVHVVVQ